MLETLFLDYANNSLREDPRNLLEICAEILAFDEQSGSPILVSRTELTNLMTLIESVVEMGKINDPKLAARYRNKMKKAHPEDKDLYDSAFEAGYQYQGGHCQEKCVAFGMEYDQILKRAGLGADERLKCYECYQINYVNFLSRLAETHDLKDGAQWLHGVVPDLKGLHGVDPVAIVRLDTSFEMLFLGLAYEFVKTRVAIFDDGDLGEKIYVAPPWTHESLHIRPASVPQPPRFHRVPFIQWLSGLVGYSLSEFLLNNDLKKLHRCQECSTFFVAKTVRPTKYCSDKCRLTFHNRRRIESGEARAYKRRKRQEGAKPSYYGPDPQRGKRKSVGTRK